ncbi:MAG: DNA internalization-related competence protein ComEC/Rec2 [Clostridiales bacterium]|nr:DNA internalization-related competence protein ComEC/Rec2 [Clostridiales bacterium]
MKLGTHALSAGKDFGRKRPLACFCLSFAAGVCLSVYALVGWQMLLLGALCLLCGLACCVNRSVLPGLCLLAAAAGFWLFWCRFYQVTSLETDWLDQTASVTVEAADYSTQSQYGWYVEGTVADGDGPVGTRVLLWLDESGEDIRPGDTVTAEVSFKTAREEDGVWALSNYADGIWLTGSASDATVVHVEQTPMLLLPRVWARDLRNSLESLFSEETAGFLLALTTGQKDGLTDELDEALTQTGLRHIVAASGLHVTLLTSALFFLLPGSRKGKGLILLPALAVFGAVTGFPPSVCRAIVMQAILLLAPVLERQEDPLTSLSLALALLLVANPYAAASVSLQLSFAAMMGILVVCPHIRVGKGNRALRYLQSGLALTAGANCFTVPLVLYYFREFSLLTPLSNLAISRLLPFLLPLGMACGILGLLCPEIAMLLAVPTEWLTQLAVRLIDALASIPNGLLTAEHPICLAWVLLCYLVGMLVLTGRCGRRTGYASLALLLGALAICVRLTDLPGAGETLTVDLLDVGQGQCILVSGGELTAVIDCGSLTDDAGAVLTDALARRGLKRVDVLILTHYDADHTNGVVALCEEGYVERILAPEPDTDPAAAEPLLRSVEEMGTEADTISGETELSAGALTISVLPICGGDYDGLCVWASYGSFDLLVTGDAGFAAEEMLLERYDLPRMEVLVAGHHGSAYATGEALLEALSPQTVLFSVGENSYGHPTPETVARCRKAGAALYGTSEQGTVTVVVSQSNETEVTSDS